MQFGIIPCKWSYAEGPDEVVFAAEVAPSVRSTIGAIKVGVG